MESKLGMPIFHSRRARFLGISIILFPVWWIIGVDQFIWPMIMSWVAFELILSNKGQIIIPAAGQIFFLFLGSLVISGFFIQESFRVLSFLQNFAYFLMACLSILVVANVIQDWKDLKSLVLAILIALICSAVVGLLAEAGLLRVEFDSLLNRALPSSLARSGLGERISMRNLGHTAFFMGYHFYRIKSIFMFSTLFGTSLAFSMPLIAFFWTKSDNYRARWLWIGVSVLFLANLVFSGGRSAILATVLGAGYFIMVKRRSSWKLWWLFWILAAFLIIGFILFSPVDDVETSNLPAPVQSIIWARSTTGRLDIYGQTLDAFWLSPFFGAGTQTDTSGLVQPLGSHSFYLALLYRHGLVGLFLFAYLIWKIWRATSPLPFINSDDNDVSEMNHFLYFGRWMLFTILLDSIFTVPLTDATTMFLEWMLIALLLQTRRLILRKV